MSRWATAAGVALLIGLALIVIAQQGPHHAQPAPPPVSDPFAGARWAALNLAALAWMIALGALPLAVLAMAALLIWRRASLPTADGRAPLNHPLAPRFWDKLEAEANAQATTVPQRLHYAPRWSQQVSGPPEVVQAAVSAAPPQPLTLAQVLRLPGLVIGSSAEGPLIIEGEATSVGVGGMPGSGKSSTVAGLVAQHAALGHRVKLADPHARSQRRGLTAYLEPLKNSIEEMASDGPSILALVRKAHAELEQRKRTGRSPEPLVIVVDEWLSLLLGKDGQALAGLLVAIVVEGQKYDITAILAAQNWMAAAAGGSLLRNPIPTTIAHRMRPADMRALTGHREPPADILELPPGHAYATGPWGLRRVLVPRAEPSELSLPAAFQEPYPNLPDHLPPYSPEGSGKAPDATERRVVGLFLDGASVPEIVQAVHGLGSNDGRRYLAAREEVEAVLRRALGGGA